MQVQEIQDLDAHMKKALEDFKNKKTPGGKWKNSYVLRNKFKNFISS